MAVQRKQSHDQVKLPFYVKKTKCSFYLSHSYSLQHGRDYKISLRLSVCVPVCAHSQKKGSLGSTLHHPFSSFALKTPILGQDVLKIHVHIRQSYICLKCIQIAKIVVSLKKLGPRNTTVTSDFRPEVEIWPFRACTMKIYNITSTIIHGRTAKISAS